MSEIIKSIEQLLKDSPDTDSFIPVIREYASGFPRSIGSIYEPGTKLYRATNHHTSLPLIISELWHPPAASAKSGRANRSGKPIFYSASDPGTALIEIRPRPGQLAVLSTWITTDTMLLHDIGYNEAAFKILKSNRPLPDRHINFSNQSDGDEKLIRDYISLAFMDPTPKHYALTAAIAEVYLGSTEFSGLLYPSIAKDARTDNLALRPEYVESSLKLDSAQLLKIESINKVSAAGDIVADLASPTTGVLTWKIRGNSSSDQTIAQLGTELLKPGDRVRVQNPGKIKIDEKIYDLKSGYLIEYTYAEEILITDLHGSLVPPQAPDVEN